jgi:hypothetical protein
VLRLRHSLFPTRFYAAFTLVEYDAGMAAGFSEAPASFVVVFFRTKAGNLHCRVTDVATRETWIAQEAVDLRRLLVKQRVHVRGGARPR